jgi:S-adenosylmethionine hydrolase
VLRARLPEVPIVDLTHEVRAQDVRAGSLALKRAAPYLATGVVVAVVDPGVGTARRPVAVQASVADLVFVGPDNGLMMPALDALGGPALAVELENATYQLPSPGPTFAGRDIFAPAAALLADGGEIESLGPLLDLQTLARLPPLVCRKAGDALEVEVAWVDRFGNVQLAGGPGDLPGDRQARAGGADSLFSVRRQRHPQAEANAAAGAAWSARIVHTFADLAPGELGLLVDSYGGLALSLNGAGAAELLGLREHDVLVLEPAGFGRPSPYD